jgi:hypothetical protein
MHQIAEVSSTAHVSTHKTQLAALEEVEAHGTAVGKQ